MAPTAGDVSALLLTQMPFDAARASCVVSVEFGMPLVRMPNGFSWMAEAIAACWLAGVVPELRSLYFQPRSAAACAQYFARTTALPLPESRPTSSLPVAGFELSGVLMPIEVGEPRNWAWYAFAAAMSALLELSLLLLLLLLLLLVLPVLLLLLLHAAISSAEVTATPAARIFLIRSSFLASARSAERSNLDLSRLSVVTDFVETRCGYWACSQLRIPQDRCLQVTRTEAK